MKLPPLREDISLIKGPTSRDGSPTWSLFDPTRNQFIRIGWQEFECLSRWNVGTIEALVDRVNKETTLTIDQSFLQRFIHFLLTNNLIEIDSKEAASILHKQYLKIKKEKLKKFVRTYLFFRIPLVKPDAWLTRLLPWVRFCFHKTTWITLLIIGCISLFLVSQQWDEFINTFNYFFSWEGLAYFITTLLTIKCFHELGHALTAKYYGCKVSSMGIIFLVFWPVLYTDTTDAWRLSSRKQRLNIAAAGILVELAFAVLATFFWSFLEDGPLRSVMFFTATTSWITSIIININPVLRFDGYYMFSDLMDIPNLQSRAFALGKWYLRQIFFTPKEPAPYPLPTHTRHVLIIYAYITWVYRFFLMLGISYLLYRFFFKFLGVLLMITAISMFIIAPIYNEISFNWKRRHKMQLTHKGKIAIGLLILVMLIFIIPWRMSITVPALLEYHETTRLYAPEGAKVDHVYVKNGDEVTANQTLLLMHSDEVAEKIKQTELAVKAFEWRVRKEAGYTTKFGAQQADPSQLAKKQSELLALKEQQAELTIKAPFAGKIVFVESGLRPNRWIKKNTLLFELVNKDESRITAYVPESVYARIREDKTATFYPENLKESPVVKAHVLTIDPVTTKTLAKPYLASTYGGPIAVHAEKTNQYELKDAFYRVVLEPSSKIENMPMVTRGKLQLATNANSIITQIWQSISAVFIRESGF